MYCQHRTFLMSFKFYRVGGIREVVLFIEGGFAQILQNSIIETMLYAMQWGFVNILEASLLGTASFAPIALGLSLSNFWQTNHRLGSAMLGLLHSNGEHPVGIIAVVCSLNNR